MKLENNIKVSPDNLKHIYTLGGVVSAIIVAYYITGLYRNYLQIKKLKKDNNYSVKEEDI